MDTSRTLFTTLILFSLAVASAFCTPMPQENPQGTLPPNRPAQAQAVGVPAPIQAGKLPPQELLPADARKPDLLLRVGHTQHVEALAFSPDGKWLAANPGGQFAGYAVKVWNTKTWQEVADITQRKGIHCVLAGV